MSQISKLILAGLLAATVSLPAAAAGVRVELGGSVEYNMIQGGLAGIKPGERAVMSFMLDSGNFLDSANFPTRGYRIDLNSFDLNIGGVHMKLEAQQAGLGDAFFVLRDNDPGVDGFFMSLGTDDAVSLALRVPGLVPSHDLAFERTFTVDTTLHSLNILDAVGKYGFEDMASYQWTIGRLGTYGLEVNYETITISAVPEPSTTALLGLGALVLLGAKARAKRTARLAELG